MSKSNYYFDNDYVEDLIKKYQKSRNIKYRDEAIKEIKKLIDAIINLYRFWRYEERSVLQSEASLACLKAIETFNFEKYPNKKNLAFSFFSLVSKKHLSFITIKENKYKTRNEVTEDIGIYENKSNVQHRDVFNFNREEIQDLLKFLQECLFFNLPKKLKIIKYLIKYIRFNQKFFDKKDFINYAKSFGITQSYLRKVMKEIENSKELYKIYLKYNTNNLLISL